MYVDDPCMCSMLILYESDSMTGTRAGATRMFWQIRAKLHVFFSSAKVFTIFNIYKRYTLLEL